MKGHESKRRRRRKRDKTPSYTTQKKKKKKGMWGDNKRKNDTNKRTARLGLETPKVLEILVPPKP